MVQKKVEPYLVTMKRDLQRLDYDFRLTFWLSILKDYARRFKPDKLGYIRVPIDIIEADYKMYRVKIWRYNRELEDKGLLKIDRTIRGGRTWMGFRFI